MNSLNKNFSFETTLASKSFVKLINDCKEIGYKTNLIFLWLPTVELAINRVQLRVSQGGHSIPKETIERRYTRGIENFFNLYMPIFDNWIFCDSSYEKPITISYKQSSYPIKVLIPEAWDVLSNYYLRQHHEKR